MCILKMKHSIWSVALTASDYPSLFRLICITNFQFCSIKNITNGSMTAT